MQQWHRCLLYRGCGGRRNEIIHLPPLPLRYIVAVKKLRIMLALTVSPTRGGRSAGSAHTSFRAATAIAIIIVIAPLTAAASVLTTGRLFGVAVVLIESSWTRPEDPARKVTKLCFGIDGT